MRPKSHDLVMRDPALAAILGLSHVAQADFGAEGRLGQAWSSRELANLDAEHGAFQNARQLDIDASMLRRADSESTMERHLAAKLARQRDATAERLALLDPNAHSLEKIGKYTFSVNQTIVFGASEGLSMTNSPTTDIKPERLIFNAPCFGFATISGVQIGNTSVIIGGSEDAGNYTNVAVDVSLSMPLLPTSNRAIVTGEYTGLTPAPFSAGTDYLFIGTFHGHARMSTT